MNEVVKKRSGVYVSGTACGGDPTDDDGSVKRETGVWYCPQCGDVEGPCDDVPSVNSGPCEASFYADDESWDRA